MLDTWIENGKPNVYWVSGFYFTQSFLTGVKQNYARKHKYPIDKVSFQYKVLKYEDAEDAGAEAPESGCYITGLFLEGAAWNDAASVLRDSDPKVLHIRMPIIHFIPNYIPDLSDLNRPRSQLTSGANSASAATPATSSPDTSPRAGPDDNALKVYESPCYTTAERGFTFIQMIDPNFTI